MKLLARLPFLAVVLLLGCATAPPSSSPSDSDQIVRQYGELLQQAVTIYTETLLGIGEAYEKGELDDESLRVAREVGKRAEIALRAGRAALLAYAASPNDQTRIDLSMSFLELDRSVLALQELAKEEP